MTIRSIFGLGLLLSVVFCTSGINSTVKAQNQDYRKVSLSVHGGATLANAGDGFNLLESRFNVVTETSANIGMGLQYALTPAWSLEAGYSFTKIRGSSESFETNMNTLSLKNVFNLNQILFVNRISNSVNPYLTAGIGYDIYKFESPNETAENNSMSYNLGVGLAFKVSQTIDLFSHYEYQIASNRVDNIYATQDNNSSGFGADVLTNLTGGIRINFGKKGTTHPSWRPVPVDVSPSDYEYLVAQDKKAKESAEVISKLESKLERQDQEYKKQISKYTGVIDSLTEKVNNLEKQLEETRDSLAAAQQAQENCNSTETKDQTISVGHYVQIFASLGLQSAENVRSKSITRLENNLDNVNNRVFIAKRDQFYEVLIGAFNNFEKAEEILGITAKEYDDAFIITFPRPLSLQELYKDIEMVE